MPRPPLEPVPAVAASVQPEHQRQPRAPNRRAEDRVRPFLMTDDDVDSVPGEKPGERSTRPPDGVRAAQSHGAQELRHMTMRPQLAAEPAFEAERKRRGHSWRRRAFARQGREKRLHASVEVAAVHMKNTENAGGCVRRDAFVHLAQLVRKTLAGEASFGRRPRRLSEPLPQTGVRGQVLDAARERTSVAWCAGERIDTRGHDLGGAASSAHHQRAPARHGLGEHQAEGFRLGTWRGRRHPAHESPARDPRRRP